jgi:hypothetical protein
MWRQRYLVVLSAVDGKGVIKHDVFITNGRRAFTVTERDQLRTETTETDYSRLLLG